MHARIAFSVLIMLGITIACGDDNPAPTGPTPPETTRTLDSLRITTSDSGFVDGGQVLTVGETVDLTACAVYSDQTEDCGITATWTSLATSIATVVNGTVTGVAPGEVEIRASYQTVSVTMEITVQAAAAVPERLSITGPEDFLENREIEVGQTVQLGADLEMSDGSVRENVDAEWTSSNSTVATVDNSGLVTARQAGGFDITRDGRRADCARHRGECRFAAATKSITHGQRILRPMRGRGRRRGAPAGERVRPLTTIRCRTAGAHRGDASSGRRPKRRYAGGLLTKQVQSRSGWK